MTPMKIMPFGDLTARWTLEAILRQALHDLNEKGALPSLVMNDARREFDALEARYR